MSANNCIILTPFYHQHKNLTTECHTRAVAHLSRTAAATNITFQFCAAIYFVV